PILPLGNFALGAALVYAALAVVLLAVFWREPSGGLLLALGPLLAPILVLGFVPLLTASVRSSGRRALQAGAAVLAAGVVAGIRAAPLPFRVRAVPRAPRPASPPRCARTARV